MKAIAGWLYYVSVDPALQHQGIGAKLVGAAEDWLKQRGAPKAMLMIRKSNEGAMRFYEALQYEPSDVKIMQKWLA